MEDVQRVFIETLEKHKHQFYNKLIAAEIPLIGTKNNDVSEEARQKGNTLYTKKPKTTEDDKTIFEMYCKSIANASSGSNELALGYGNRSAFFLRIEKYRECIEDIDRAINITKSDVSKVKLLCRKVECLKMLGSSDHQKVLDTAKAVFCRISSNDESMKKKSLDLIEKANITPVQEMAKTKIEKLKIANNGKEEDDSTMCKNITLKYNEKYGRHLVANRDFNPGDIIYVEKIYFATLNPRKKYIHCQHCLRSCLSLIPCENCNWAMFCSESCKTEALQSYHYVECRLIPFICSAIHEDFLVKSQISARILLMAIKEVGSIKKLKNLLREIDNKSDRFSQKLNSDETFEKKLAIVYQLKCYIDSKDLENIWLVLISIALIKLLFKDSLEFRNCEDLIKNEDATFIGSLFFKLWKINSTNAYSIQRFNESCNHPGAEGEVHRYNLCCMKAITLTHISCFFNHSCNSNVFIVTTDDQRRIFFAIHPIKKGSQMFNSYGMMFYRDAKENRQEFINKHYKFICECDACKYNWPVPDYSTLKQMLLQGSSCMKNSKDQIIMLLKILKEVQKLSANENIMSDKVYKKIVKDMSKCIITARKLSKYSNITCLLNETLLDIFVLKYGIGKTEFDLCDQDITF